MHPKDFIEYWGLTRTELAELLDRKLGTVDHWLSAKSSLEPPEDVLNRLDELHARFLQWQVEDQHLSQLRQLYELLRDRKQNTDD